MTWLKFTLWLLVVYNCYYGVLILWDYLHKNRRKPKNDKQELTFVEDIEPAKASIEEIDRRGRESPVVNSGGVSLKELFNLAREESVEYIKSVSF